MYSSFAQKKKKRRKRKIVAAHAEGLSIIACSTFVDFALVSVCHPSGETTSTRPFIVVAHTPGDIQARAGWENDAGIKVRNQNCDRSVEAKRAF